MAGKRNYKKEYKNFQGTPTQRRKNDSRKKARRLMVALGKARPGDGKDVHHVNGNPMQSTKKNLKVVSKKANRSFPRTKSARKKK